jgi:hypothetical protein
MRTASGTGQIDAASSERERLRQFADAFEQDG